MMISRVVPFAIYMLFIALQSPFEFLLGGKLETVPVLIPILYFTKILFVGIALIIFWKSYEELKDPSWSTNHALLALLTGSFVFVLWVNMDWPFAIMGTQDVFPPYQLAERWSFIFIGIRVFGASIVVPLFEELFWRSFILRYIINPDFQKVKIGTFTWPSFLISSILFGLEHNLWLAGIMAGVSYNLILYRTGNIWYCILAHGITNLLLGIFVVQTGNWQFW